MADSGETVDEFAAHPGDPKLDSLGDIRREMATVYARMRRDKKFATEHGNALFHALNCISSMAQWRTETLWTKRAAKMWEERAQRQNAPEPTPNH